MADFTPTERIDELERAISKMTAKRDQLSQQIQDAIADVAALRRVEERKLLRDPESLEDEETGMRPGQLRDRVLRAVEQSPVEFTSRDIVNRVSEAENDLVDPSSVSTCLRRLVEEKCIEEVEKGQGRKPSKFRRLGAPA